MLAKQVLSQLSYTPTVEVTLILKHLPPFRNPFLRIFVVVYHVYQLWQGFMCGAVCKCGTHKALDFSDVVLCVFLAGPVSSGPHNAERHRRNKLDGYRALAVRPDSGVTLFSRRKSLNRQFPYIVEPLADLPAAYTQYVIDFQSETVGRLSHLSPNQYKEPNWLQVDTGTR